MCCSLQEYNVEILNIHGDCSKKAKWSSQYTNKMSLENINCVVIVIDIRVDKRGNWTEIKGRSTE